MYTTSVEKRRNSMVSQNLINDYIKARKEPFVECITKSKEVYYLDIENHIIYTKEEIERRCKRWLAKSQ